MTSLAQSNPSAGVGLQLLTNAGVRDDRDSLSTRTLDRIAHLAALATGASVAQIDLLSEDQRIPVAAHGDPTRPLVSNVALDAAWRDTDAPLAVEDTHAQASDAVRAYAAARLKTPAGVVLGTVCVANFEPRAWTSAERAALAECAALAGEELAAQLAYVTEARARLEADRAQADAELASRAKSDFLAVLSRELRGQLDSLGGYVELLAKGQHEPDAATRQDDLRRLQLGQRHLLALVDDVLSYSSLEHGASPFHLAPVSVRDALREAEASLAARIRAKALFLSLGDCRGELLVLADARKLSDILANLLSNAVRFTSAGGRVDVTCDATRTDVRIRIRDTGVGIPADKLDVIFEPFVQLRADPERTVAHAGLGLAISRALARGQGGDLTAESTVGSGSTFTLTLPRAKRST